MQSNFNKTDRSILAIVAVIFLLTVYFLLNDDWLFLNEDGLSGKKIGTLISQNKDIRHKNASSFIWNKAQKSQDIRVGDAIFSGKASSAEVRLEAGADVKLGENSLVVFRDIGGDKLADLSVGNFRVKIDGNVKLAIQGEVTELNGKNSQVQVFFDKEKKPQLKLIEGEVELKTKGQNLKLNQSMKVASLTEKPTLSQTYRPFGLGNKQEYFHYLKLFEIYEGEKNQLREKNYLPLTVNHSLRLNFGSFDAKASGKKIFLDHASMVDFSDKITLASFSGAKRTLHKASGKTYYRAEVPLANLYLGRNYYKASFDKENWSQVRGFQLKPMVHSEKPKVSVPSKHVDLVAKSGGVDLDIHTSFEPKGYVVQSSRHGTFNKDRDQIFWLEKTKPRLSFYSEGTYYIRVRAVNTLDELTAWSAPQKINVKSVVPPAPPLAHKKRIEIYEYEKAPLSWSSVAHAQAYEVQIYDEFDNILETKELQVPHWNWQSGPAGLFSARLVAKDRFQQNSLASDPIQVLVKRKPVLVENSPLAQNQEEEKDRDPAALENTSVLHVETEPWRMNDNYKSGKIALEGSFATLQSKEQIANAEQAPVAAGAGIRAYYWWDHSGLEGSAKNALLSFNETGTQMRSMVLEGRYHFRFITGFPFGLFRKLQTSLFTGYEYYRNTSSENFSAQYELIKAGISFAFPVFHKWDAGGEYVYGYGLDGSTKYEISGYFDYFLSSDWSTGAGYRIHLFEAGSLESSPSLLPYREGYTELYSTIRYHY